MDQWCLDANNIHNVCLNAENIMYYLYLEEEFSPLLHDLLDLQEASSIHEEELVPHRHAETASVAEGQNLLEALGLHSLR